MSEPLYAPGLESLLVDCASLNLLDDNPRRGDVESVAKSLTRFGQRKPIVVRSSDRQVTAGNHTLLAARSLGWAQVAAVIVDDDAETARAFALADNRTHDLGDYDDDVLDEWLAELAQSDSDLVDAAGFDVDVILAALPSDADEFLPYAEPEPEPRPEDTNPPDRSETERPSPPTTNPDLPAATPDNPTPAPASSPTPTTEPQGPRPESTPPPPDGAPPPMDAYGEFAAEAERPRHEKYEAWAVDPEKATLLRFGDLRAKVSKQAYRGLYDELLREANLSIQEAGRLLALRLGLDEDAVEISVRDEKYAD